MTAAPDISPDPSALAAEWERVELLGHCVAQLRQGTVLPDATLERLRSLQARVTEVRRGVSWRVVHAEPLSLFEYDVLACVVAPELEPRVGWLYQALQPGLNQPYPSRALIQEMLAMSGEESGALHTALSDEAPLRRLQLVDVDEGRPFEPVRPARWIAARLLGAANAESPPPGTSRVTATATWDDLVLPPEKLSALREFLFWMQHRRTVVDAWGGRSVGGPLALFSGPSGTGKTMAASVIASALGWPLYRVDLGFLVSKYVGETEKNLNRLFAAAHGRPMVLQFDEADSLFSKRGEVKEARDRYANMEVSHLLSRIEAHDGPCILTTNLRRHLDQAFARRFQVVVDFPRPDAAARAQLWRLLLPPRAPREDVDLLALAGAINLTGGAIRNAALHAAYLAAGTGRPIGLPEIALAIWRELGKDGRELSAADMGPLARHLPEGELR